MSEYTENKKTRLDCALIQDLLPLYADDVCSAASAQAVEEHLAECVFCRELAQSLRETAFTAQKLDLAAVDGMKKVQKKMQRQNFVSALLAVLLFALGIQGFWGGGFLSLAVYAVFFVLCIAGVYEAGTGITKLQSGAWADRLITAGSVFVSVWAATVFLCAIQQITSGSRRILGVAPEHCGPFLANIWLVCFGLQLVSFFMLRKRQRRAQIENRVRQCVCVTGMFLLLAYVESLRHLESVAGMVQRLAGMTVLLVALGAVSGAVVALLCRRED